MILGLSVPGSATIFVACSSIRKSTFAIIIEEYTTHYTESSTAQCTHPVCLISGVNCFIFHVVPSHIVKKNKRYDMITSLKRVVTYT